MKRATIWVLMMGVVCAGLAAEKNPLKKQVRSVIVPKIDIKDAALPDVLDELADLWAMHTKKPGEKEGVRMNFILQIPDEMAKQLKVTLKLNEIPFEEVVKYVAQAAGLRYRVEEFAIRLYPHEQPAEQK